MEYDVVIGIEVHAELKSKEKLFSPALNQYGKAVNELTSLIDTAQPGALPVINKECVDLSLTAALALKCDITKYMEFDRKNYFYPDIPKGYQITQDRTPIGRNGSISFKIDDQEFDIGITRLHIEEDTAKSIHLEDDTLLDFNRSGSPLIEIVSEPELKSPKQAAKYIETLRSILLFAGVSDVRMEEGSMRCDANISLMPKGSNVFGTKVEIKNLNSISKIEKSLMYEIDRQTEVLNENKKIIQETRRYDDLTGETVVMRTKEGADDYRYHYDPNLPPIVLTDEYILNIKNQLPELPDQKRLRYVNEFGLSEYDASVLTLTIDLSQFFEEVVGYNVDAKKAANYIMGDISSYLNKYKFELSETNLTVTNLVDILSSLDQNVISSKIAKEIISVCFESDIDVNKYIQEKNLKQISNVDEIDGIVISVINENEKAVNDYKGGHSYAFKFLVGQVMKATKGKANPEKVVELLKEKIE